MFKNKKGFTLIELLIVIAIVGILSAVVLIVLNPTLQRTKANEAVLRANVDKICLAWGACKTTSTTGASADCDTADEIGITPPTGIPATATYTWDATNTRWQGDLGTCKFYCDAATNAITLSGTCNIPQ